MLPKYGFVLHPTHPRFAQEYPILADILRKQNERVDIRAKQEKKNPFAIFPLTKAFSERNNSTKKDTWQTRRNSDGEYHHPTFTPTFQYEQINRLPQGDSGAWRTPTHRMPLHFDKQKTFQRFVERKQQEDGFCYLYLFKTSYRYSAFKLFGRNPSLKTLNLERKYPGTRFKDLQVMIDWGCCQIHVNPDTSTPIREGFIQIHPSRLLEQGWHELYTVGSEEREKIRVDEQDYAQMTPYELEKQVKMIRDAQEKQRVDAFERTEAKKKEEARNMPQEEKLITQFKLFAKGLKTEN
jgi:hypothetical protein